MSIKVGIIGAGGMAAYHAQGFREAGADIVALADTNAAAAEKAAARYGIARHFGDVAEMFRAVPELDAVIIATPDFMHSEHTVACLKAGKYVGICGQGPSDHPDLAQWLRDEGILSLSLNPDTVVDTWQRLAETKVAA